MRSRATGHGSVKSWRGRTFGQPVTVARGAEQQNISGPDKSLEPVWQCPVHSGRGRRREDLDLGKYEVSLEPTQEHICYKDMQGGVGEGGRARSPGRGLRPWGPSWAMGMWLFPLLRISDLGQRGPRGRELEQRRPPHSQRTKPDLQRDQRPRS